jgi:hypothetical protein
MLGAKKQRPPMKKDAIQKCKGLKSKTFDEKKRQPQNAKRSKESQPIIPKSKESLAQQS